MTVLAVNDYFPNIWVFLLSFQVTERYIDTPKYVLSSVLKYIFHTLRNF